MWFQSLHGFCEANGLTSASSIVRQNIFAHKFSPSAKLIVLGHVTMRHLNPNYLEGAMDVSGVETFVTWNAATSYQKKLTAGPEPRHGILLEHEALLDAKVKYEGLGRAS